LPVFQSTYLPVAGWGTAVAAVPALHTSDGYPRQVSRLVLIIHVGSVARYRNILHYFLAERERLHRQQPVDLRPDKMTTPSGRYQKIDIMGSSWVSIGETKKNRSQLALLIMAGAIVALAACARSSQETLTLPLLDGKTAYLSDYDGRVVALNFWASWCPPCRTEMPALQDFHDQYQDLGLVLLGVNLHERESAVRSYTEEINVSYPIVLDRKGEIAEYFRIVGPPATILIGRDGQVVKQFIGPISRDQLDEVLSPLLKEDGV
jgi:thiol-disulfide isomerase/thioredoxin